MLHPVFDTRPLWFVSVRMSFHYKKMLCIHHSPLLCILNMILPSLTGGILEPLQSLYQWCKTYCITYYNDKVKHSGALKKHGGGQWCKQVSWIHWILWDEVQHQCQDSAAGAAETGQRSVSGNVKSWAWWWCQLLLSTLAITAELVLGSSWH